MATRVVWCVCVCAWNLGLCRLEFEVDSAIMAATLTTTYRENVILVDRLS